MNIIQFPDFVRNHTEDSQDEFFTSNSLVGELGELANVRKKNRFYEIYPTFAVKVDERLGKNQTKPFREQSVDEAGDTLFYYIQWLNKMGITVEEVIAYQMAKIQKQSEDIGRPYKK